MEQKVLYSIVGGPSFMTIHGDDRVRDRLHFVCYDCQGQLSELYLYVVGRVRQDGAKHQLLFSARDAIGHVWSVSYDALSRTGNIFQVLRCTSQS